MHVRGYGSSETEVNTLVLYFLVALVALILWAAALADKLRIGLRSALIWRKRTRNRFDN